jgi:heptosyltransferase-2
MSIEFKKIALWQTAFLGDAVLTLPLINALEERFPGAEIHFFVRAGVESLFTAQKNLSRVYGFAKRGDQKSLKSAIEYGRSLGRKGFDLFISAHTSMRSALIARSTGIPVRIGYDAPWYNRFAYTHTVQRRFNERAEIERLMALGVPLGIGLPAPEPELDLPEESLQKASDFYSSLEQVPVLGIHPGSVWETKRWPAEYFSKLIDLASAEGVQVIAFGGPGEEEIVSRIISGAHSGDKVLNLAGTLNLPDLAAYIRMLDCYVSNDSGPMHIAWVQNVPLVAIFGPTVEKLGFYPRGNNSTVLEERLACRPCGLHGGKVCPEKHHNCMRLITPAKVWQTVAEKLSAGSPF